MMSIFRQNLRDGDMWIEAFEAKYEGKGKCFGPDEWDQLLGHYMGCMVSDLAFSHCRNVFWCGLVRGTMGFARRMEVK